MSIELEFKGYDRVRNALRYLAAQQPKLTDPVIEDWAEDMRDILKNTPYPSPRPGQRYVRTFQLRDSWAAKRIKPGEWQIVNEARGKGGQYAWRVVGNAKGQGQSWMHKGRWWVAVEIVSNYTPELTEQLTKALVSYWNRHG